MTKAEYRPHDDVIKWKHILYYWPFMRGIHQSPVNSPHKGQWCGALMFSLICAWIRGWVNNRGAGDLRCHHAHYDITVMRLWPHKRQYIFLPHGEAHMCLLWVQCGAINNVVTFLPKSYKIYSIAHPSGRAMGCILWVETLIYTYPQAL